MKRLGLLALLLVNSSVYSLNIVQGWYGGITIGLNYTPSTDFTFPATFDGTAYLPAETVDLPITLKYSTMGQLGGQVGYRCGHFRGEVLVGFNNSPYGSLNFGNVLSVSDSSSQYYTFVGATNTGFAMFNAFYDVLPVDSESNMVPFIGAGIGYAYTQNTLTMDFWSDDGGTVAGYEVATLSLNDHVTSPAGEAMIGVSYFLDDLTTFGLDLRYFTTQKKSTITDARVQYLSVNVTFNGAFNFG